MPHPTTLVKLVRRAGPEVVDELNAALVGKLATDKLLRARKLGVDTTVVEADIDYRPTPTSWSKRSANSVGWSAGSRVVARPAGPGSAIVVGQPGGASSSWPAPCAGARGWRWVKWIG